MLKLEIDGAQIERLALDLALTERQVQMAMRRALARTTATLRRNAQAGLRGEFGIRAAAYLRQRLKAIKARSVMDGAGLWFGLNDIPVSALRGRVTSNANGATFAGKAGSISFPGAFVQKAGARRSIYKRKGEARLPIEEQRVPVEARMAEYIEREIFSEAGSIFWRHFERDMLARSRHGIGAR